MTSVVRRRSATLGHVSTKFRDVRATCSATLGDVRRRSATFGGVLKHSGIRRHLTTLDDVRRQ
jgi:hypothetical protein